MTTPVDPALEARILTRHSRFTTWLAERLREQADRRPRAPLFVGLNGPQGSGKTTITRAAVAELQRQGRRAISLSIDDFYLTRAEQMALAEAHPENRYWQQRGYPGTHDIALGARVLQSLRALGKGESLRLPRYEKSAHQGRGDRAPPDQWPEVQGPLDCVFLEGWMLGFRPVPEPTITDPALGEVNARLRDYEVWDRMLDARIHLSPPDLETIVQWRVEAEERMKNSGKPGMTRPEAEAYVRLFLPAYQLYLPAMESQLKIPIGADRLPRTENSV